MSSSRSPASYSSPLGRRTMTLFLEGWVPLSEGVPPAEPLRSYWHSYAFYAITPGAGGLEAGFVGCQSLEETRETLLPAYLQGVPLWVVEGMLADARQWGCLGSRRSTSLLLLPDVSGECLHRVTECGCWLTEGGYPGPSRESSAEAVHSAVNGKEVWVTSGSEAVCAWCLVGQIPNSFPPNSSHHRWAVWAWGSWLWSRLPSDKHGIVVVGPSESVQETSPVAVPLKLLKTCVRPTTAYFCCSVCDQHISLCL